MSTEQGSRGRGGRPSGSRAGEVNERILEAATRLFLQRGYEGTSCDQVALDAHAGKASIYARYANKEALFAAVIKANLGRELVDTGDAAAGQPLRERLTVVGLHILEEALRPNAVALLRLLVAEAPRFPEIAATADRIGWQSAVQRAARAIAARTPDNLDHAQGTAAKFIDLLLAPHLIRALLGEDPEALRAAAPQRVKESLAMLTATGWFEGWE